MNKILFSIAVLAISVSGFSQEKSTSEYKPVKGTVTTEVGVTGGLFSTSYVLNEGVLRFRYFIKSDLAFRLGLGLGSTKTESTNVVVSPTPSTTTITRTTSRTFNLGIEKHFAGTDRLSTYIGADLLIGFNGASQTNEDSDGTFANVNGSTSFGGANRAGSSFGVRAVTGADYYFTKKLYLGVEVGLSYVSSNNDVVSQSVKGTPTGPTVDTNLFSEGKGSATNTSVVGGVRLGYQF